MKMIFSSFSRAANDSLSGMCLSVAGATVDLESPHPVG
jgi:hypothetical protein